MMMMVMIMIENSQKFATNGRMKTTEKIKQSSD